MKNIILIILTFFTLSLFGQTEQPDEFRAPTGVIKSIKGTNFKKSIKVIGGKNVTVYEQPNTDTYNTFSIVNDSVRIQKWKLDTATNVFVTSNLNDVYLDNLVNKPSVDSRVVLDVVNDSLKVEVWDIINNTLLSTYYIDNVGNHAETVTTLTNTIPNGNLIGTYTNEAGAVVNIKETLTAYNDQTTSTPHLIGKYLDEFGNLTDINETLTSLNSTLSTGHLIGQYVNEDNVGVTIKESIIGVVNNADGSATITKEDGTTVTTTPYPNTNFVQTNDSLWIHTNLDGTKDTIKVPLPTVNTDTRLQLSVVNDSIKIEVVDVLTNTVTSTSYLDNMVNQPDIITTITDTLVGGHLVANYNNEANTIRGIYESIIQVDSITNGYVITKEDGLKDTIKLNATGFYTLTSLDDTLALTTIAASKCPALTIAKLDSCNVAYLYMFNCSTGSWETFKTPNIKTATRTLYVDRSLGNNTKAKEECPTCQFEYPEDALSYALSKGIENPSIHVSADTFTWGLNGRTYPYNIGIFNKAGGTLTMLQDKAGVFKITNYTNTPFRFLSNQNFATNYYFDLGTIVSDGQTTGTHDWYLSGSTPGMLDEQGSFILKARNLLLKHNNMVTPNTGFLGTIAQFRSKNVLVECENIETDVAGFVIDGGVDGNIAINVNNYTQTNARAGIGYNSFIYVRGARINSNVSFTCRNLQNKIYYGSPILLDFNVYPAIGQAQSTASNYKVKGYIDNYVRTDNTNYYTNKKGLGAFDAFATDGFIEFWNRNGIPSTSTNVDYFIEANNVEEFYPIINNITFYGGMTLINSKIHIKINNAKSKSTCVSLSGWTLVNTQILIEGDFTSDSTKCVSIFQNNLDATSSITLKGKFKTTSPTLEAMEIGNNSGAGVNNIIINGQIITGGGFSIDNPSGTPISVKVMPGCASNVTTSANVTQLGTGIYVDPNFNN